MAAGQHAFHRLQRAKVQSFHIHPIQSIHLCFIRLLKKKQFTNTTQHKQPHLSGTVHVISTTTTIIFLKFTEHHRYGYVRSLHIKNKTQKICLHPCNTSNELSHMRCACIRLACSMVPTAPMPALLTSTAIGEGDAVLMIVEKVACTAS